ncbi:ATP-binding protein [Hyphomicrobium sp. DY-1]|uniref:ATP-binding protein n=1 Tax=Hyphomicrobium sp. DY-1 TaxID=3075650 RepID=UPI0039C13319
MTQPIIALVGISGVGKSTLLRAAAETLTFQHLQASALIKEAKERRTSAAVASDELRTADIADNQALLVEGFGLARNSGDALVVLDGHTVIDTPLGLITIEPSVFAAVGVTQFIFVADDPNAILSRRTDDQSRNRPQRSALELEQHQEQAVLAAFKAALHLGVPLHMLTPHQREALIEIFAKAAEPGHLYSSSR